MTEEALNDNPFVENVVEKVDVTGAGVLNRHRNRLFPYPAWHVRKCFRQTVKLVARPYTSTVDVERL